MIDPAEPPPGAEPPVTGRKNSRPAPRGRYLVVWAATGLVLVGGSAAIVAMHGSGGRSPQAAFCGLVECSVLRSEATAASAPTGSPHPQPVPSPVAPSRTAPAPTPLRTPAPVPAPTVTPPPAPAPEPTRPPGRRPMPIWTWPSRWGPPWPSAGAGWSHHSRWWRGQSPWWEFQRFHQPHWW